MSDTPAPHGRSLVRLLRSPVIDRLMIDHGIITGRTHPMLVALKNPDI
jgi:hypothetical protein